MANFVMDFLQRPAQDIITPAALLGNEVGAVGELGAGLVNQVQGNVSEANQNQQEAQHILDPNGGLLHQGGVLQGQETQANGAVLANPANVEKTAGTGLEIGTSVVPGGEATDIGESIAKGGLQGAGKKLAMDFLANAPRNAAVGTAATVGGEMATGGGISPTDILRGATGGARLAGATDAGRSINAGFTVASQLLDDVTAQKVAGMADPKAIEKELAPHVGPVVAQDVSGAVARANDPSVVQNIVQNDIQNKLPSAPPQETPLPPQGPTTDINTPNQVTAQAAVQPDSISTPAPRPGTQSPEEQASLDQTAPSPNQSPSFINPPGQTGPSHVNTLAATTGAHY